MQGGVHSWSSGISCFYFPYFVSCQPFLLIIKQAFLTNVMDSNIMCCMCDGPLMGSITHNGVARRHTCRKEKLTVTLTLDPASK